MAEIKYGTYWDAASRFAPHEAWVFNSKERKWNEVNAGEHAHEAREMSKADWEKEFPNMPPLPPEAFKTPR